MQLPETVLHSQPMRNLWSKALEPVPKHGSEYAEYALRYITNNYSQNIHITELAEKIGVVRSYLTKSFTTLYHMSPQEYLIRLRLERASYYLENSSMAIADISDRCGFSDLSSFCKLFKKRLGSTPTEYRRMNTNKQTDMKEYNIERKIVNVSTDKN